MGWLFAFHEADFLVFSYVFLIFILFQWRPEDERREATGSKIAVTVRWCRVWIAFFAPTTRVVVCTAMWWGFGLPYAGTNFDNE